jgi:hypothetical protein
MFCNLFAIFVLWFCVLNFLRKISYYYYYYYNYYYFIARKLI